MHLIQFEALSSGPRFGLVNGGDVSALREGMDLADMACVALRTEGSLTEQAHNSLTKQRFSFNELLLDGRIRPPIWPSQPEHLQLLRQTSAGWQALADGRNLCRPAMPLPSSNPELPLPLLLLAVWVSPKGQAQPLGLTLGLQTGTSDIESWCFGPSLLLSAPAWGHELAVSYEISRMAAPILRIEATLQLPNQSQIGAMLTTLGPTAAAFALLDLSSQQVAWHPSDQSLEHGDSLLLTAPGLGLELRSLLHHDAQP